MMKHRWTVALCTVALAGTAIAQRAYDKPSAAWTPQYTDQQPRRSLETRTPTPTALPAGTAIRIKLDDALSSAKTRVGDPFTSSVAEAITVNGQTLIPAGSTVIGRIDRKSQPRRYAGHPSIRLRPEKLMLPNGRTFTINASVVDSGSPRHTKVSERGNITGPEAPTLQKAETVALTGTGAIAGGIIAGPPGLLIGSATGATVSAGHYLVKRHSLELPAGTVLILELNSPVQLGHSELAMR